MIKKLAILFMAGMILLACDQNNNSVENNEIQVTIENSVDNIASESSVNTNEGQTEASSETSEVSQTETTSTQQNVIIDLSDRVSIDIDPRIELISIIQYLSDYFVINYIESDYKERIDDYFDEYRDHEVVKELENYHNAGFCYDAPVTLMLMCEKNELLSLSAEVTERLVERIGSIEDIERYISLCNEFIEISNFDAFLQQEEDYYKSMVDPYSKYSMLDSVVLDLENYYGDKQNKYSIILGQLQLGSYGPRVLSENGMYDVYSVIGPGNYIASEGRYSFGGSADLLYHEFGHSFVNPLGEKYSDDIEKYSHLYEDHKKDMERMHYGRWDTVVNEYIVRAVEARMLLERSGETSYKNAVRHEEMRGFVLISDICDKLAYYENNRTEYKSFEDYYPELLKAFEVEQ